MLRLLRCTAGLRIGRIYAQPRFAWYRCASTRAAPSDPDSSQDLLIPRSAVRLRDYQEECIRSVLSNLSEGRNRLGVSLATGSGKTVIFTQLIDRVKPRPNNGKQSLILVHRKELVEQAASHCRLAYPGKSIEIEMANSHASGAADITIASIRSLLSKNRIEKFDPSRFKLVLVDEAHHIVASTYSEVLKYFGLDKPSADGPALVGVSATFSRFDGLRLGAAIDHIVYHKDYVDMIGEKWLADVLFTTVKTRVDLSKVADAPNGDYQTRQLSAAVNTDITNDLTVRSWMSRGEGRKSTLVFCVDIDHVRGLTAKFRELGVDARYITSQTPKDVRTLELDAFKKQEYPVLVNCGLFTEGTDIPNIDCVVLARPTRSKNLLVQMIGRGLRLYPGKENCHIIDMVASVESGVLTTPTLFGLDPGEGLKGNSVDEIRKKREQDSNTIPGASSPKPSDISPDDVTVTITDYDSVQDLVKDSSGERHIRAISGNSWVRVSRDRYILSAPGGKLTITQDEESGLYSVNQYTALGHRSKSPLSRPREVAAGLEFTQAVHAADTLAGRIFGPTFISLWQPWRKKPASEGQIEYLKKRLSAESDVVLDDITKGQATDMITKLNSGAKGQFKKLLTAKRNIDREKAKKAKLDELRDLEQVRVGPVSQ